MEHIGCHLSSGKGYLSMGETAVSIGANTFQFFTRNPRGGSAKAQDPGDVAAYIAYAQEHAIGTLIAHAPYTLNLCSAKEEIRAFSVRTMEDDLGRLQALPSILYNFHPGSHTGQGMETGIWQIADALKKLLPQAGKVTILLETMAGKGSEVGGRFEELREIMRLCGDPENLGVCLDTCHVWDAGYDLANQLEEVLASFDSLIGLERLKALHINDSKNPCGAHKDRHEKLGEGCIGMETLTTVVCHPLLRNLPMILETPNELDGYAREIRMLRNIWETAS